MLQAKPGRSGKQQQEQDLPNLGTAFQPSSVQNGGGRASHVRSEPFIKRYSRRELQRFPSCKAFITAYTGRRIKLLCRRLNQTGEWIFSRKAISINHVIDFAKEYRMEWLQEAQCPIIEGLNLRPSIEALWRCSVLNG